MKREPLEIEALVSEMADGNFEDERLVKRLKLMAERLARRPEASLPRCFDSAGLEGAYRFLSNPRVDAGQILKPHLEATRARCAAADTFLVVHDSTQFSYRYDGEREGLGRARRGNEKSSQLFLAHVSLALSADGTRRPLGLGAFKTWTRGPEPTGTEFKRWEEQANVASAQLDGRARAIHVMDREADDYEMFYGLQRDGHRFVVRCQHNRVLDESSSHQKLRELLAERRAVVEIETPLSRRKEGRTPSSKKLHPARDARSAKLCVAAATALLRKPRNPRAYTNDPPASLPINVVRVWEPEPPSGQDPIEWYLYTSEPIETAEQLLAVVDYYRARWTIEEYFKVIKTGCDFERRQLGDYEALVNLLAVFAPIAYHSLLIRSEARRAPEQPATEVLSPVQLEVLRVCGRMRLPATPTARDVYFAVAALGGHIKYSGDPGWLTLARGYEQLDALTQGWLGAKLQPVSDQR